MEIRILSRQGKGIREISRITGLSRNTVRKYLREPEKAPGYSKRKPRGSKLDPFKRYIERRVTFGDKTVEYRSVEELRAALREIDAQLARDQGRTSVRQIRVTTDKGF